MRGFCDFEKQIIADVNKDSSSLSCVHVGKERPRRNLKLPLSLNKNNKTTYYKPDYMEAAPMISLPLVGIMIQRH